MATYNFTVRATDNLGAYADQNFSLTVNNTNIERWCIVGSTGLAHSSDGVNWSVEAGQSGGKVTFGNGKWVVYGGPANAGTLGLNIRTSTDAFNWSTLASGIPTSFVGLNKGGGNYTYTVNTIHSLKYQNGLWTAFVGTMYQTPDGNGSFYSYILEYNSPDLVTWTFKSSQQIVTNSFSSGLVYDHYIDTTGTAVVLYWYSQNGYQLAARTANASTLTIYLPNISSAVYGTINYINGLYCVNMGTSGNVYTSIDGMGWTSRTVVANNYNAGFTYANGRLITRLTSSGSQTTIPVAYSLNGGRTWTTGGSASTANPLSGYAVNGTQQMAYYGGRLIVLKGSADALYATSTDSGTTMGFEVSTIGTQIGSAYGVAVRV